MLNLDIKGLVTVTIRKPNGDTYKMQQENAISSDWVREIHNMLASGSRFDLGTVMDYPNISDYNALDKCQGYFLLDDDQYDAGYRPNVGMPLVFSGERVIEGAVNSGNSKYRVMVPFVPRQITCVFVETNRVPGVTENLTASSFKDKSDGRIYRYVFGNTRVHFTNNGGSGGNGWQGGANSDGNRPRLDEIEFVADGLMPSEKDSSPNSTGTGAPLHGRRVPTGSGGSPASASNRAGRFNQVIRLKDADGDDPRETIESANNAYYGDSGIHGQKCFRINSVGLITGYSKGVSELDSDTYNAIDASGVANENTEDLESFRVDPYRFVDRGGKQLAGSYKRPVFIGRVIDDDSSLSTGFPSALSTYTWRNANHPDNSNNLPAESDRPKYEIDANDSVTFSYKLQISHNFKEYNSPGSGVNSSLQHANRYSYRVVSAILKRPVAAPWLNNGAPEDGSGSRNIMRTNYGESVAVNANNTPGLTVDTGVWSDQQNVINHVYKQEYSMEEWQKVCWGVAITGFSVTHSGGTSNNSLSQANTQTAVNSAISNNTYVCQYSSYVSGVNSYNRATGATSKDTASAMLGGTNSGGSSGHIVSYSGSLVSSNDNSTFMFPADNLADINSNVMSVYMKGDTHFIYKGVDGDGAANNNNGKPRWCTYFVNYTDPELKVNSGESLPTLSNQAFDTLSGNANQLTHLKPIDSSSNVINLIVSTVNLQEEEDFNDLQHEDSNQKNNFTSGVYNGSTRVTTWQTDTSKTNNLMMSHFLSITHTNPQNLNSTLDPEPLALNMWKIPPEEPPTQGGS